MKTLRYLILSLILVLSFSTGLNAEFYSDIIVTSPNGIWTDSRAYSTLNAAITSVGANQRTVKIVSPHTVTNLTIPSNVTLEFERDGSINNSGQLTINTLNIIADNHQVFTGIGDIDFAQGSIIKSSWFDNIDTALSLTSDDSITLKITKQETLHTSVAVGNNVILSWDSYLLLGSAAGITLSNIGQVEAGNYQIFSGPGSFQFRDGTSLSLKWFANLRSALTHINTTKATLLINDVSTVDYSDSVPSNISLKVLKGGELSISNGITLTLSSASQLDIGPYFFNPLSGAGSVTITGGATYTPATVLTATVLKGLIFTGGGGSMPSTGIAYTADGISWSPSLTAPTGDVVGTTDSQQLSNKSFGAGMTWPTFNQNTTGSAAKLNITNQAAGDILYFDGTDWVRLAKDVGKFLQSANASVAWVAGSSGSGDVATDVIWDAAGDVVYGTGSDTATRLAVGTAGQVLAVKSGATQLEWKTITTSAAGSNTQLQFNDGGTTLAGATNLTWDKTNQILTSNILKLTSALGTRSKGYLYLDENKTFTYPPTSAIDMDGILILNRAYGAFDSTAPGVEQYTPVQSIYASAGEGSAVVNGIGASGLAIFLADESIGLTHAPNLIGVRVAIKPQKDRVAEFYDDIAGFTVDNASGDSGYQATDAFYVSSNGPKAGSGKWSWLTSYSTGARSKYAFIAAGDHDYGLKISGSCATAQISGTGFTLGPTGTITSGVWQGTAITDTYISSAATWNAKGDMLKSDNLSGLSNYATARSNLGLAIGTNVQAYNSNLTAINQALTTSSSPTFVNLNTTLSVSMADQNALNINTKSAVYGNGTAIYFGWGFASTHMRIADTNYTLSVDGSGFVKATAE